MADITNKERAVNILQRRMTWGSAEACVSDLMNAGLIRDDEPVETISTGWFIFDGRLAENQAEEDFLAEERRLK